MSQLVQAKVSWVCLDGKSGDANGHPLPVE